MKNTSAYHLTLSVSNSKKSKLFYDVLFQRLGWEKVYDDAEAAGYSDGNFTLWILPTKDKKNAKHHFGEVGFHHFSVRVQKKADVDTIYSWCLDRKVRVVNAPKKYPEYSAKYYAVFFVDPDGMKIEVTYR